MFGGAFVERPDPAPVRLARRIEPVGLRDKDQLLTGLDRKRRRRVEPHGRYRRHRPGGLTPKRDQAPRVALQTHEHWSSRAGLESMPRDEPVDRPRGEPEMGSEVGAREIGRRVHGRLGRRTGRRLPAPPAGAYKLAPHVLFAARAMHQHDAKHPERLGGRERSCDGGGRMRTSSRCTHVARPKATPYGPFRNLSKAHAARSACRRSMNGSSPHFDGGPWSRYACC